jgi:hypothetical protein
MVGIIPGIPAVYPDTNTGFADIRATEDIADYPKRPDGLTFNDDGSGIEINELDVSDETVLEDLRYPRADEIDMPTNSNLARNTNIRTTIIQDRRDNLIKDIPTADGDSWSEPYPAYNAKYPFNNVTETESGHIFELDDTPNSERIHLAHRSGSFTEFYPSGSKVEKIVKNNYKLVLSDDNIYVTGKVNITVDSHANIKVAGDVNIQAENNLTVGVAGDATFSVGGTFAVKADSIAMESASSTSLYSLGSIAATGVGAVTINGAEVSVDSLVETSMFTAGLFKATGIASLELSAGTMSLGSLGAMTLHTVGAFAADGTIMSLNSGIAPPVLPTLPSINLATPTGLPDAPAQGSPTNADSFIEPTPVEESGFQFDAGEEGADEHIQNQIDGGVYTYEEVDAAANVAEGEADTTQAPDLSGTLDCGNIENLTSFPESIQLTDNYTLGDVTGRAPFGDVLRGQHGLSKGDIACNLKLLAANCLEPILAKYSDMIVTNAFRKVSGSGRSQHEVGQAADLQFPNHSKSEYYDIARWIRDNVPHDQLLLEYKTFGTKMPWIHISFNKAGNRPSGGAKNATFLNHKLFKPYYVQLA